MDEYFAIPAFAKVKHCSDIRNKELQTIVAEVLETFTGGSGWPQSPLGSLAAFTLPCRQSSDPPAQALPHHAENGVCGVGVSK